MILWKYLQKLFFDVCLFPWVRVKNVGKGDTHNDSEVFIGPVTGDGNVVSRGREPRIESHVHLTS